MPKTTIFRPLREINIVNKCHRQGVKFIVVYFYGTQSSTWSPNLLTFLYPIYVLAKGVL